MGRTTKRNRRDSTDKVQRGLRYSLATCRPPTEWVSGRILRVTDVYVYERAGATTDTAICLSNGPSPAFAAAEWTRYSRVSPRRKHGDKLPDTKPRKRRYGKCIDRRRTCAVDGKGYHI